MKGLLLNRTQFDNKKYTIGDSKGFVSHKDVGVPQSFYGGRVKTFAKCDKEGVYLCVENMQIIDIYIPDLTKLTVKDLKAVADIKLIEYPKNATKDDMLTLLA